MIIYYYYMYIYIYIKSTFNYSINQTCCDIWFQRVGATLKKNKPIGANLNQSN